MKCVWFAATGSPSTSATNYHYPTAVTSGSWITTETQRSIPLSDDITITRFRVWVQTAPGSGNNYAFTIRDTGADTSAAVTISDTNTEGVWTGTVNMSQLDRISVKSIPTSTPTAPVRVYWIIDYETTGNFYLIPSATGQSQNADADLLMSPFGGNLYTPQGTTPLRDEAVIPTNLTVTKIACYSNGNSGNEYWVRKNNTTDSSFSVTNGGGGAPAVSSTGSFTFAAGDTMLIKQHDSGASWTTHMICITVEPEVPGEIVTGFTSPASPSTTVTEYEGVQGYGDNDWDATEANVYMRFPLCRIKNLYVKLTTATGAARTRTFTVRNGADTSVVATLTNTATGNDTTNVVQIAEGDFVSMKMVPTGTPAATAGAKFGFVMMIDQPEFFAMFE